MGKERNNSQSKRKEESTEKELNEIKARHLSYIEFKVMVTKMLKEINENYKELYGSYKELSRNYISMEKT